MKWRTHKKVNPGALVTTTIINQSCYLGALHVVVYGTPAAFNVSVSNRDSTNSAFIYARIFTAPDMERVEIDTFSPVLMEGGIDVNVSGTGGVDMYLGYYEITANQ